MIIDLVLKITIKTFNIDQIICNISKNSFIINGLVNTSLIPEFKHIRISFRLLNAVNPIIWIYGI